MAKKDVLIDYWKNIDDSLDNLLEVGYAKLPNLKSFNLDYFSKIISEDTGSKTFKELGEGHKIFLKELEIDEFLTPKLYEIAKSKFGFKGSLSDQYHIARKVVPGNSKEMFRAHFDSHLFTIVFPIKIPKDPISEKKGDLIFFPYARKKPITELNNLLGKLYFKRFASEKGIEKLSKKIEKKTDDFQDYRPLLFLGNSTLHTNFPVSKFCDSYRLTLLSHFFDPSSKFGIGSMLRRLRSR
tara:strand:- start:2794 stop:3513 length:720 start_codon:yes stop_codon:yes gene_type:complete